MQVELQIVYDTQTHGVKFAYSLPNLFTERRDILYAMLGRTYEEAMLTIIGGKTHNHPTEEPPYPGSFGKGTKTNVDGL